jgi:hypothetical protein
MEEFWRNVNSIVFKSKKQESMLRQMFKDLKIGQGYNQASM